VVAAAVSDIVATVKFAEPPSRASDKTGRRPRKAVEALEGIREIVRPSRPAPGRDADHEIGRNRR